MNAVFNFTSKEPIGQEPADFMIEGLSVRDGDGDLVHFRWREAKHDFIVAEDGHVITQSVMQNFDSDFYRDNNEALFPGIDVFSTYTLCEVHYQSFDQQGSKLFFDLDSFMVFQDDKRFTISIPPGFDINK